MTTITENSTPQDTYNAIHARCIELRHKFSDRIAELEAQNAEMRAALEVCSRPFAEGYTDGAALFELRTMARSVLARAR